MRWDVNHLPTLPGSTPQSVLQVHRILLEAMTNVLRHAKARTMTISALPVTHPQAAVSVTLHDDGAGMPDRLCGQGAWPSQGHGLVNMHTRAEAMGAQLNIQRATHGGTQVSLPRPQQIAKWKADRHPLPTSISAAQAL